MQMQVADGPPFAVIAETNCRVGADAVEEKSGLHCSFQPVLTVRFGIDMAGRADVVVDVSPVVRRLEKVGSGRSFGLVL